MKRFTMLVDEETLARLERLMLREGKTRDEVLSDAVHEFSKKFQRNLTLVRRPRLQKI